LNSKIKTALGKNQRRFFIASCKNCIYDESKRLLNLKKHYLDFIGCEAVFAGFTLTREDKRENYGKMRFQTLGLWHDIVVFIVHTPRGEHEQRIYWQHYNG
jgi:hypothetical protein